MSKTIHINTKQSRVEKIKTHEVVIRTPGDNPACVHHEQIYGTDQVLLGECLLCHQIREYRPLPVTVPTLTALEQEDIDSDEVLQEYNTGF